MSVSTVTQSYVSFDPTNCDDPVNPAMQNITNSKKESWKIPSIRKLFIGALAVQGAAMAPKAEGFGTIGCIICLASGVGLPVCWIPCGIAALTIGIAPLL